MGSYDPTPPRTALEDAHESITHTHSGKREVIYPFAFKNLDWDEYHKYRPRYPDSLLKMWLSYHRENGTGFGCAHDVGAGPGTLAIRLSPRFSQLLVSDAGQANITSAKRNLANPSPGGSKCTFIHSPAEALSACVPPASVDFVSVGMAFHYFDAPRAIAAIARMLKPGGTLAAVTYGFNLSFPGRPHLHKLWHAAASKETLRLLRAGALFPAAVKGLAAAMAGLDSVPLPLELFEPGPQRILINVEEKNAKRPLYFVEDDRAWESAPDRVGRSDVRRFVRDRSWRREADVEWLRGFLASCQMGFGEETWMVPEWRALEDEVRRAGGSVLVEWPVAVVLATRNKRPVS